MYDIKAVRKIFPHTKESIYFNAASTGPLANPARQLLDAHFNKSQLANVGDQSEVFAALENIRGHGARILGCRKSEAGFGFNTTFGINLAAFGLPLKAGDEILLSDVEFPANVYPWLELRRRGMKVTFIKSVDGFIDLDKLQKAITRRTKVLSLSYVQYFNGFKIDIDAIAEICRKHKIFLVLDCIQAAGCEKINLRKWNVAVASAGAQKWLLSPQGTGLFYVSEEIRERLQAPWRSWLGVDWKCRWHDLRRFDMPYGKSARQFEMGTYPSPLVMALDWTLQFICGLGTGHIQKHNYDLLDTLIEYLRGESFYRITSALVKKHRSSILSFTTDRGDIGQVHQFLAERKIVTALRERSVRVSAHLYNNAVEISQLIAGLDEAAKKLKRK